MAKKYIITLVLLVLSSLVLLIVFMITFKDAKTVESPHTKIMEYSPFNENTTVGFVITVSEDSILLDISDWAKRSQDPKNRDDYAVEYKVILTKNTIIRLKSGEEIGINDIKENHIVQIIPPLNIDMITNYEGEVDEIIVLD